LKSAKCKLQISSRQFAFFNFSFFNVQFSDPWKHAVPGRWLGDGKFGGKRGKCGRQPLHLRFQLSQDLFGLLEVPI
jgi:hypothetical protein